MRYVPTSAATAEALKKQAKKLQRKSGGKHAGLLDRIAHGAGYNKHLVGLRVVSKASRVIECQTTPVPFRVRILVCRTLPRCVPGVR